MSLDDKNVSEIDNFVLAKNLKEIYGLNVNDDMEQVSKQLDVTREGTITITEFLMGACNK
jgi:uncharacterized protein YbcV (DUF1398 family)